MKIDASTAQAIAHLNAEVTDGGAAVTALSERVMSAVLAGVFDPRGMTRADLINAIVALSGTIATLEMIAKGTGALTDDEVKAAVLIGRGVVRQAFQQGGFVEVVDEEAETILDGEVVDTVVDACGGPGACV